MKCRRCFKTAFAKLKSRTKGKIITLCEDCFNKSKDTLINGHNYYIMKYRYEIKINGKLKYTYFTKEDFDNKLWELRDIEGVTFKQSFL